MDFKLKVTNPAIINLFKSNSRNSRSMCKIYSKLTINTAQRRRSGVFIVDFEQISHIDVVFLLLTLKT